MPTWEERHRQAEEHVLKGRQTIKRQRTLIDRQKGLGHSTAAAEAVLASFERSQANFDADLAHIERERE